MRAEESRLQLQRVEAAPKNPAQGFASIVTLIGVTRGNQAGRLVLDWTDAAHWSKRPRHCRTCAGWTHLLDDAGLPSHKVCAEAVAR